MHATVRTLHIDNSNAFSQLLFFSCSRYLCWTSIGRYPEVTEALWRVHCARIPNQGIRGEGVLQHGDDYPKGILASTRLPEGESRQRIRLQQLRDIETISRLEVLSRLGRWHVCQGKQGRLV